MRLDVTPMTNGNFGSYSSPGYGPKPYAGIVHGPVDLRFSWEVVMQVPFVRVIQSEKPQIIVGVDLLCGGGDISRWNWKSIEVSPCGKGSMCFYLGSKTARVPLFHWPTLTPRYQPASEQETAAASNDATHKLNFADQPQPSMEPPSDAMLGELLELLIMKKATEDATSQSGG